MHIARTLTSRAYVGFENSREKKTLPECRNSGNHSAEFHPHSGTPPKKKICNMSNE